MNSLKSNENTKKITKISERLSILSPSKLKDNINGGFELFGGFFIILNIMKVLEDKSVAGVDWRAVLFFTIWGYWNLHYYPSLGQKASFWGGIAIAIANTVWVGLLLWFSFT